jgi:hypothetical protein
MLWKVLFLFICFHFNNSQNCLQTNCFSCVTQTGCSKKIYFFKLSPVWCGLENSCKFSNSSCLNSTIHFLGDSYTKGFHKNASKVLNIPSKYPGNYLNNFIPWNFTFECENFKKIDNIQSCPSFKSNVSIIYLLKS